MKRFIKIEIEVDDNIQTNCSPKCVFNDVGEYCLLFEKRKDFIKRLPECIKNEIK